MVDDQTDFLQELKQRKVFRVAVAYIVVAWVALQFFDLVLENTGAPSWVMQTIMALLAVGFPAALVLAWAFDLTPSGIESFSHASSDSSKSRINRSLAISITPWEILISRYHFFPEMLTVPETAVPDLATGYAVHEVCRASYAASF